MSSETATFDSIPAAEAVQYVPEELRDAKPFAALKIGPTRFEIANGQTEEDLMYRTCAESDWVPLKKNLENGWQEICAEILISTRDAVNDYAKMHTIKMTPDDSEVDVMEYNLFGFQWSMRLGDGHDGIAIKIDGQDWIEVTDIDLNDFPSRREAAIYALVHQVPALIQEFEQDVWDWATRLSAGATVEPIM